MDTAQAVFFFQAEDGIRDAQESRGLGDVYKRQVHDHLSLVQRVANHPGNQAQPWAAGAHPFARAVHLSLIHI